MRDGSGELIWGPIWILILAGVVVLAGRYFLQKRSVAKKATSDNYAAKKSAERDMVGKALSSRPAKQDED
ncbi:MAG: hypothetical protein K8J08_20375 [Thermoanaerobaculia bacterium]|nr:hypothetical protein [Thermoanaerobaculia bacterium]